ncbi:MAG: hypothetical protein ACU84J_01240 [Gammaproteobacteria bacterium]
MLNQTKKSYCSRCGEEIFESEHPDPIDPICALCEFFRLEAEEIFEHKINKTGAKKNGLYMIKG